MCDHHINKARKWWFHDLNSPKYIMSPMVGQSELAFRDLCRNHGTELCYTPMFISEVFVVRGYHARFSLDFLRFTLIDSSTPQILLQKSKSYRKKVWQTHKKDRPLIVQFCGSDPDTLLRAAKIVEKDCDAVDLNLGCPQKVAERGQYGAFMMDQHHWKNIRKIISTLSKNLAIPVTVKVRSEQREKKKMCLLLSFSLSCTQK